MSTTTVFLIISTDVNVCTQMEMFTVQGSYDSQYFAEQVRLGS